MGQLLVIVGSIISVVASIYSLVLLIRIGLDWAQFLAPRWRPRGFVLVFANLVYALTDPPLRWLRRFIPPLRLGPVALDMGVVVLFFGLYLLQLLGIFLMSG